MKKEKNKKDGILSFLLFLVAVVCVASSVYLFARYFSGRSAGTQSGTTNSQALNRTLEIDGETYTYNYNLTNILFLGIDKGEEQETHTTAGWAGQSDCIMIISLDSSSGEARVLQISRETMTDIDIYGTDGRVASTITGQLALQYGYGLGGEQSCLAAKKTVGELIPDVTINGYVSLDISAIPIINDALGGITLTLTEDFTDVDESYVEGATITLYGDEAERFVRYRDTSVTGSNEGRMRRQVLYISALFEAVRAKSDNIGNYYETFYSLVSDYLVTNLSADDINDLATYDFQSEETRYAPGELVAGEEHDEFYIDEDELLKMVAEFFYEKK